jgi:hypothetical protein
MPDASHVVDGKINISNLGTPTRHGYVTEVVLSNGSILAVQDKGDEVVLVFDKTRVVSVLELTPVVNDDSIEPYVSVTLNVIEGHRPVAPYAAD